MAKVYFITGSLGAGKTLSGIDMVRRYLAEGRRVATNVNLNLEYLCNDENKHSRVMRVPDSPEIADLRAIGFGSSDSKENTHGLLLLDELGTWFNARDFASKGRLEVVKWMIHMRKRRWDVAFIVQDFSMVDKQARGNIAQYLVTCQNSKTMWLFKLLPKFHVATVRMTATRMIADRWFYRGSDLYQAYDTEQLFHTGADDGIVDSDAEMADAERKSREKNGLYCLLPPAYFPKQDREEIRQRFQAVNKRRSMVVAGFVLCLLTAAGLALWPSPEPVIAESSPEVVDALPDPVPQTGEGSVISQAFPRQSDPDPEPAPVLRGVEKFRGWQVRSYSYIGGSVVRAEFTDGVSVVDLRAVQTQGLTVSYDAPRAIRLSELSGLSITLRFH